VFHVVPFLLNQTLSKLQEDLKACRNELHASKETTNTLQEDLKTCRSELDAAKETTKTLLKEKYLLEQKIQRLEKKKNDEVFYASYTHIQMYLHQLK